MKTVISLPRAFAPVVSLGAPRFWHPVKPGTRLGSLLLFLFLLVVSGLILSYGLVDTYQASRAHGPALIDDRLFLPLSLSSLVFLASLLAGWNTYRLWNRGVAVYEGGIALHERRGARAWRWEQVVALTAAVTSHYPAAIPGGIRHTYTLRDRGGESLVFSDSLKDVEGLAHAIEEAIFPRLYDQCAGDYNRGGEVPFGPVTVSLAGIAVGKKQVPWAEVGQVSIQYGSLRVARKGGGWFGGMVAPAAHIPNLRVLLSVIDQVAGVKTG